MAPLFCNTKNARDLNAVKSIDDRYLRNQVKSNSAVMRYMQDLISERAYDERSLNHFTDLLTTEFNWREASAEEIEKCRNIALDLIMSDDTCASFILQRLISQLRSTNKEYLKVDICGKTYDSILVLKKHLRQILVDSPSDVDLQGENYTLLLEVLKYHPRGRGLQQNVSSIFASSHKNPRYNGLRCFFYRNKDGFCDDFSYARCADNVKTRGEVFREHICDIIIEMQKLLPSMLGTIMEMLYSIYPHQNIAIEQHVSVTKAILYIAKRIEPLRSVLYRLLISKLTIIDAEIKLVDPNSVDVEKIENLRSQKLKELADKLHNGDIDINEAKSKLQNPNWFKDVYEKMRTEEDIDDMSQKLDILMAIMFEDLQSVLRSNSNKSACFVMNAAPNVTCSDEYSTESDSDEENEEKINKNVTFHSRNLPGFPAANETHMVKLKLAIDTKYDDPALKTKVETFEGLKTEPLNSSVEMKPRKEILGGDCVNYNTTSDVIISELIDTFEDVILPTYNCKYVQFLYLFAISFNYQWTKLFLQRLFVILYDEDSHIIRRRTAASYIASLVCRAKYIKGQLVCGTVCYLFRLLSMFEPVLLRPKRLSPSEKRDFDSDVSEMKNLQFSKGIDDTSYAIPHSKLSLFYSIFQDILYICCYHADALAASPRCIFYLQDSKESFIAYLDCYLRPLSYCKSSIISKAIEVTGLFKNLHKLHDYLINVRKTLHSDGNDYNEADCPLFSPIDSFFPFDPYLLHHSNYYIRDKYRKNTQNGQSNDLCNKFVKLELDARPAIKAEYEEPEKNSPDDTITSNGNVCGSFSLNETTGIDATDSLNPMVDRVVDALNDDREIAGDELKSVGKQVQDSIGFSSIPRVIKAKLDHKRRNFTADFASEIEADYDFWGYDFVNYENMDVFPPITEHVGIQDGPSDRISPDKFGRISRPPRLKRGFSGPYMKPDSGDTPIVAALGGDYSSNSRDNGKTHQNAICTGQSNGLELCVSSAEFTKPKGENRSKFWDSLISSAAYKSALVNLEITKLDTKQLATRM